MSDLKFKTQWFTDSRFGLFIHWGIYAMAGRHEWIQHNECISIEDYKKYVELFDPDLFDAKEWARLAKAAGMKYVVFTTKHHEGFCMWDTQYTDYKCTNAPAGRDLLREVVDAFRAEGIRIGFYYSLLDWHHPDFVLDSRNGPYRNHPDRMKMNEGRDQKRYAQYMRNQVTELLTNYGQVDILWFDFSYPAGGDSTKGKDHNDWESEKLLSLAQSLQPHIIVDNRLDLPAGRCDIITPEQYVPANGMRDEQGDLVPCWEGCQTMSGSWGYYRDETSWKTPKMCVEMLINHVSRGGNLIMNVGPTSRGYFDHRAVECLEGYAGWMKYNSRSIYGCTISPFKEAENCRYTYNPKTNRLYVHILSWPFRDLHLPELTGKVYYAQFLHDGSEVKFTDDYVNECEHRTTPEGYTTFILPVVQPKTLVPVIEIILK